MLCFLQAHFRMWTLCLSSFKESAITFMDEVKCVFTRFIWSMAWTGDLPAQELHTGNLWKKEKGICAWKLLWTLSELTLNPILN